MTSEAALIVIGRLHSDLSAAEHDLCAILVHATLGPLGPDAASISDADRAQLAEIAQKAAQLLILCRKQLPAGADRFPS